MERSIQSSVVTLLYISGAAHIARTKPNIPAMDKSSPKNDCRVTEPLSHSANRLPINSDKIMMTYLHNFVIELLRYLDKIAMT